MEARDHPYSPLKTLALVFGECSHNCLFERRDRRCSSFAVVVVADVVVVVVAAAAAMPRCPSLMGRTLGAQDLLEG